MTVYYLITRVGDKYVVENPTNPGAAKMIKKLATDGGIEIVHEGTAPETVRTAQILDDAVRNANDTGRFEPKVLEQRLAI